MNDNTHELIGTQRTVRAIRRVATQVARSVVAAMVRVATVTATSPLTVTIDGTNGAVPAFHLNVYSPTANDRVICLVVGRQIVVLGTFT